MKRFINSALAICSPLAAVPTGWAIFAGVTGQPAFPMNPIAAAIGAIAIIVVDIAAAMLVTDIYSFNQSARNQTEQKMEMSVRSAWAILGIAVSAEIVLSLFIVVLDSLLAFGVLVFPIMTLAGVFAFAVRFDLQKREAMRENLRKKKPKVAENDGNKKGKKKKVARRPVKDDELLSFFAGNPGATDTQVAEHFGVSRQAIGQRRKKLYSINRSEMK